MVVKESDSVEGIRLSEVHVKMEKVDDGDDDDGAVPQFNKSRKLRQWKHSHSY